MGYSPGGHKELDTTERLSNSHSIRHWLCFEPGLGENFQPGQQLCCEAVR